MRLKNLLSKRVYIDAPAGFALILAASVLYFFAAVYVQPGPFSKALEYLGESGAWIYFMNWLPIVFCIAMAYCLFNNCVLAVSLSGAALGALSIANYLKIKMRQAPLMPWDLSLGGEVLGIARSFSPGLIAAIVLAVFGMAAFVALSAVFARNRPVPVWARAAGAGVLIAAALLMKGRYADAGLYGGAFVYGSPYNEVDKFISRGFVYSFAHTLAGTKIEKPPGYDRRGAEGFLSSLGGAPARFSGGEKPHIIAVMGEAFSDMPLSPWFDFSGYTDPIANFTELAGRPGAQSGHIVAPNIGGGTSDTEFDVLTGINSRHYRGVPYAFSLVNKPVASLASELAGIGYSSVMIHPGDGWFYDRANAYPFMGFGRLVFLPEFEGAKRISGYVSEADTISRLIEEFEAHLASSGAPLFEFCITIQNHGPYLDKYSPPEEPPTPKNFETELPLSESQLNTLYNYFLGLADADRELARLVKYLEESPEPAVLLYFGDHLPSLDFEVYEAVLPEGGEGHVSGETRFFRVPYVIWKNPAAQAAGFGAGEESGADVISSQYLGAKLLRGLGYTGGSGYFGYVAETGDKYPVVFETRFSDAGGTVYAEEEWEEPEALSMLRKLEYYRLFPER